MATRRHSSSRSIRSAAAGSWIAILAATTLGDAAYTVRAEVRADGVGDGAYRLVVQSYDATDGAFPASDVRPVGSVQRSVTADELRRGVQIDLLELRQGVSAGAESPVVLAWIEAGEPDLEFDGRRARPAPGSVYGVVKRPSSPDVARISLDRRVAIG